MNKEELITYLKDSITKTQSKRDNYDKRAKGGMCLVMTGRIEAFNEVISVLENKEDSFVPSYIKAGYPMETIVDYNTAKELKSMGFDVTTFRYWTAKSKYTTKGLSRMRKGEAYIDHNNYDAFVFSAPTKVQVEKWLEHRNK